MAFREPQLITEALGGSALSRMAQNGGAPPGWYAARPASPEEWRARAAEVRMRNPRWWGAIRDACTPNGAAFDRITSVAEGGGVVVTTGQQPGLFGGPVYTWSKALSALALANELAVTTGLPTAPVFWAATDDADFDEACWTMVALAGGAERLELPRTAPAGSRLADIPLGDVRSLLATLRRAAGSAVDSYALDAAASAYHPATTIGGAYVALLRRLLEPLGITVLDAAHESVSRAAHDLLAQALRGAPRIDDALDSRAASMREQGVEPQVSLVQGLTLVFERDRDGKRRVPSERAATVARSASAGSLSPNVLLRPVIERALLPTVAYMAGPAELAYFAQVSAVADALAMPQPLALPRWSVTIVEPQVAEVLERYELSIGDFADPHAVETRLARSAWPAGTKRAVDALRAAIESLTHELRDSLEAEAPTVPASSADAIQRTLAWRLNRFSRRVTASVKRHEVEMMRAVGTARGSLYPGGIRQERALNLLPLLARYGAPLFDSMCDRARDHARSFIGSEVAAPASL